MVLGVCVPSKSDELLLTGGHQGFINPGLILSVPSAYAFENVDLLIGVYTLSRNT